MDGHFGVHNIRRKLILLFGHDDVKHKADLEIVPMLPF